MAIVTKRRLASPVIALVALGAFSGAAFAAAPVTATNTVTLPATTDGAVDVAPLNSQFTKMTIKVNDGSAFWGPAADDDWTTYRGGTATSGNPQDTGLWGPGDDSTIPGHGPILLEGKQVGTVIYRIDGGAWQAVTSEVITRTDGLNHTVQVAYNDRPGSYDDNSGSLTLTVVRTK